MAWVWDLDLPTNEKFILLAYADHADHDGYNVYPAVDTVAKKTGYKRRAVQLITRKLEERGLLIDDGKSQYQTNKYSIPIDGGAKITSPTGGGAKDNEEGVQKLHEGVQSTTPNVSHITPEPSLLTINNKPSVKPSKGFEIPDQLNSPQFLETWEDFQQHRKEIKKKLTPLAGSRTLNKLSKYTDDVAIQMLEQSIENGWTGVFEIKNGTRSAQDPVLVALEKRRQRANG